MSVNQEILHDINFHVDKLEKRLKKIYKLPSSSEYFTDRENEAKYDVNVLEQIDVFDAFISIYSVMEQEDIRVSDTANEYCGYLKNLREGLVILNKEKEEIEKQNWREIENIKLLLNELYKKSKEIGN